jgi:hypothetical protein
VSIPISEHFTLAEFACHDGTPYPVDQIDEDDLQGRTWFETRLAPLVGTLESIRANCGDAPLIVDSGYRTFDYDQRLYEADAGRGNVATPQGSQHPKGRAADIRHESLSPKDLHDIVLWLFKDGKLPHLGGIGLYPTFVHVDVRPRPSNHLAQWGGTRDTNIA